MTVSPTRARELFDERAWRRAKQALESVQAEHALEGADLERLAACDFMLGDEHGFAEHFGRAHHAHLEAGDVRAAIRAAAWTGIAHLQMGEPGQASGWFGRADRLLEGLPEDSVERGWLRVPAAVRASLEGNHDLAFEIAGEIAGLARRHGDHDLFALAVCEQGRARIKQGRSTEGLPLLDEVMVTVTAGETSPVVTGIVYCSVIEGCNEAFAIRRAGEWTDVLKRWCDSQSELVTFSGQCHVHRAAILQLHGAWNEAIEEAHRSRDRLAAGVSNENPAVAYVRLGELARLQGRFADADDAYREVSMLGGRPQPGLALLRLAEGDRRTAVASIARALAEAAEPVDRARLLPAAVEIHLAVDDVDGASDAAGELAELADASPSPYLHALSAAAIGSVALARGDARGAIRSLRTAAAAWQELDAPYELARVRVLIGRCCEALDDRESARLEEAAARAAFQRLGADPDIRALDGKGTGDAHGLTDRELEVLRLVAGGSTNRQIAEQLYLSVKTVDRHVSNIFTKLGVSSRTSATAWAYQHSLV